MDYLPSRTPGITKRLIVAFISIIMVIFLLTLGIATYVGWSLTHPDHRPITTSPSDYNLDFEKISFPSADDNLFLQGWWIPAKKTSVRTIIFAHGYGRNRLQDDVPALAIAKALNEKGYNILMFDFRNSGESEGQLTSIGQFEKRDLEGAISYVSQNHPEQQIALLGFSMGAATSLMVGAENPKVKGVLADSPFADLPTYLADNLSKWSGLPKYPFTNIILTVIPPLTGLNPEEVRPLTVMPKLNKAVLFIHGTADEKITSSNSEILASKMPPGQSEVWLVQGADHVGSFAVNNEAYITKISEFFKSVFSQ